MWFLGEGFRNLSKLCGPRPFGFGPPNPDDEPPPRWVSESVIVGDDGPWAGSCTTPKIEEPTSLKSRCDGGFRGPGSPEMSMSHVRMSHVCLSPPFEGGGGVKEAEDRRMRMLRGGLGRPRRLSSLSFCCPSGLRATSTRPWRPVRFWDGQAGRAGGGEGREGHALVAVGLRLPNLAHGSRRA